MEWCGACQDHFSEDHYDSEGNHRVGPGWGPTGTTMAIERSYRVALERIAAFCKCEGPMDKAIANVTLADGTAYYVCRNEAAHIAKESLGQYDEVVHSR